MATFIIYIIKVGHCTDVALLSLRTIPEARDPAWFQPSGSAGYPCGKYGDTGVEKYP